MITLADSLAHQNIIDDPGGLSAEISETKKQMTGAGFSRACLVRMVPKRFEKYDQLFVDTCRENGCFFPIALVDTAASPQQIRADIAALSKKGFRGVKIHPRISKIQWSHPNVGLILSLAQEHGLVVYLCTYMHADFKNYPERDPLFDMTKSLAVAPGAKTVLVHGGDVEVLRYAELARANTNLLLDLSFTIMKYQGSSIDTDIQFLFKNFDRRICIGVDYPEYTHADVRKRFEFFARDLDEEKIRNIGHKNLQDFLEWP